MNERRLGPGSWYAHGFVWCDIPYLVKGCTTEMTIEHPGYVIKRDTTWQSEAMRYFEEIPIPKFDAKMGHVTYDRTDRFGVLQRPRWPVRAWRWLRG